MDEWSVDETETERTYTIFIEDDEVLVEGEITAPTVKDIAKEHGVKNFHVRNTQGHKISPADFPVKESIIISAVNKAG